MIQWCVVGNVGGVLLREMLKSEEDNKGSVDCIQGEEGVVTYPRRVIEIYMSDKSGITSNTWRSQCDPSRIEASQIKFLLIRR